MRSASPHSRPSGPCSRPASTFFWAHLVGAAHVSGPRRPCGRGWPGPGVWSVERGRKVSRLVEQRESKKSERGGRRRLGVECAGRGGGQERQGHARLAAMHAGMATGPLEPIKTGGATPRRPAWARPGEAGRRAGARNRRRPPRSKRKKGRPLTHRVLLAQLRGQSGGHQLAAGVGRRREVSLDG